MILTLTLVAVTCATCLALMPRLPPPAPLACQAPWREQRAEHGYEDAVPNQPSYSPAGDRAPAQGNPGGAVPAHRHIARLYDAGVAEDGQPYMALEYVEGTPITEAADDKALDALARVRLLRQVMDAVQCAHANLVIQRDLEPGNVLVTADGAAMLLDFGIDKLVEDEAGASGDSELTRLGGRALTLRYAAPELIAGGAVSTAVDIWALGVLLYELLTGLRPFGGGAKSDADGGGSIEQQILTRDPARPSHGRAGAIDRQSRSLAGDLDTIALNALKKQRADRYATVDAFADDLDRWLRGEPVLAERDTGWYRTRRFVGRNKAAVSAATLASAALIAAASAAVVLGLQARVESARAVAARDFMVNIFRRADPDLSQGKEVSAKQLLTQGYKTVLDTMEEQPLLQAELLRLIVHAIESMLDVPATDAALSQTAVRYQRVGKLRAAAALTVDRAALRLGSAWEVPVASDLLGQAEALYPAHADDEEFSARHAIFRSYAAHLKGNRSATQARYAHASTHAGRGLLDASPNTVFAVRSLAIIEIALGLPLEATQRLRTLRDRLQADKAGEPADVLSVMVELPAEERNVGRFRVALQQHDAARGLCQISLNPNGTACVYNHFHRATLLLLLGMDELAMEVVPFLAPPRGLSEDGWGTSRLIQADGVLAKNQQLDAHPDVVSRVIAAGNASSVTGDNYQGQLAALVVQARHHLREGRPRQAMALSTQAQSLIADRGVAENPFVVPAQALRGISLHMMGAQRAALQQLDSVHAQLVQALGAEHPRTQLASIVRARPLWALQRHQEAVALIDHALPVLRGAMGAQAPTFVRILTLRAELAAAAPGSSPDMQRIEFFI